MLSTSRAANRGGDQEGGKMGVREQGQAGVRDGLHANMFAGMRACRMQVCIQLEPSVLDCETGGWAWERQRQTPFECGRHGSYHTLQTPC